jgi:hypothetical protein
MDALTLLREVSEAYRGLQSLELEAVIIGEWGDENANSRSERRVRFFYAAPDRIREEPCGKGGILHIADGKHFHSDHVSGEPRCTSLPVAEVHPLPYFFNPEWPTSEAAFLYQRIRERVVSAEILRLEDGCYVVSVEYRKRPLNPTMVKAPVLFWVDERNRMVMRRQGKSGHRPTTEDEVFWSRHTVMVQKMRANEPIPEETFQFTPPPRPALETGHGGRGFVGHNRGEKRLFESHRSYEWQGETLVEHAKFVLRGMNLAFRRRLSFSDDGKELRVIERVSGPKGKVQTSCKLPVS